MTFKQQVENIKQTIDLAVLYREVRLSEVKAPLTIIEDGLVLNFRYCIVDVHASGVLRFTPTKRTFQKECPCCGTMIDI